MRKVKILEDTNYTNIIQSVRELEDYFSSHAVNSKLTFDWETTGLEYNATPLLMSLHFHQDAHPYILPINYYFSDGLPMNEVADVCNRYFPKFRLVAHNAKYDSMISKVYGIKDEALKIYADTLVMVHLYNPDLNKKLETRVKEDFGFEKKTFEEFISVGLKRKRKWSNINWDVEANDLEDTLASYSAEDAWFETKVYNKYKSELDEALWRIHDRIEIPLIDILRDAKIRGVLIDKALIEDMDVRAKVEEARLLNEVYDECGEVFNLNSSKQKQEIFFGKLKYPQVYTTKSGAASTDSATFKKWAEMGLEIGITLNEYSKVHKLITGYLDTIPLMLDEHNVLRGDLNSCGTKTGRMSSSDPNLQNQPNNPKFPVRKAFIPRPGYVFVNYDYSQLELRVMAHLSKDPKFIHIFKTGGDPHGDVSKRLGIPRKSAKVMNFGVLYGMWPNHFADIFNVSIEEATKRVEDYHKTYAGFAKWKEQTENFAKRYGYVRNMFGRRRWLPEATKDPFHRNNKAYYGALREAVNCVDTETEIFTKRGWLRHNEVHAGDIALTYNGEADKMEWQTIDEVIRMPYKGNMVSMEGSSHSSLSTPNHRWFVRDAPTGSCVTRDSEFILNMSPKGSYRIPTNASADFPDNTFFTKDWLKLFGVFLTDGHQGSLHQIEITQSSSERKTGNIEEIERLIKSVGADIVRVRWHKVDDYAPCKYWYLRGDFVEWCKKVCDSTKRVVVKDWLYTLSQQQAQALLDGIILGDGYKPKDINTYYIGNVRKSMINFFSEVAVMAGKSISILSPREGNKNRDYYLTIKSRMNVYCGLLHKKLVPYDGEVWCPHLPNQSFVMRRNGKVCITRNTIVQGSGADLMKLATIATVKKIKEEGVDAHFLLQVHDENLFEAKYGADAIRCEQIMVECMEHTTELCIPLIADGKIIANWSEMHDEDIPSLPFRFDSSLYLGLI